MSVSIDDLWATILQDKNSVGTSSVKNRRVVILGDSLSGRKTLIAKLINEEKVGLKIVKAFCESVKGMFFRNNLLRVSIS